MPIALDPPGVRQTLLPVLLALPWLLVSATVPDAVLYNQLAAVAAWGLWMWCFGGPMDLRRAGPAIAALVLCAAMAATAGFSWQGGVMPVFAAAAVVLAASAGAPCASAARPVAMAFWLAGLSSAVVATVQYFWPELPPDSWLIAASGTPGRAVGNMRQPNHLATALLCAMVATAWLWQARHLPGKVAGGSVAFMVLALAMSASRTGALSLAVLVVWAWTDRRLPRAARVALALTPLIYGICWVALAAYASLEHGQFYGTTRLQSSADISSSRLAIWKNALSLLAAHPWTGVGWGHFNLAWTLTPFPDRPVAFFDHTHNLPLQLAVEIGIPAAGAVLGLLGWALWRGRGAWSAELEEAPPARFALVTLVVFAVHSLLEYPLWYPYFLLPAAWALGVFLGVGPGPSVPVSRGALLVLRAAALMMLTGALWAGWEHHVVEKIFAPSDGAASLPARIAVGRQSPLFGHHADYAAVTTTPRDTSLKSFRRPLRQLVDVRLLVAYIEALRVNGLDAEALYAAQRLREFHRPDAQAYFKDCASPTPPWQCNTAPVALEWRDLQPLAR